MHTNVCVLGVLRDVCAYLCVCAGGVEGDVCIPMGVLGVLKGMCAYSIGQ